MAVDPSFCQTDPNSRNGSSYQTHFHFYYGGSGGFARGSIVSGGGFTPIPGENYSTTTRGGFGGSSRGDAGGGHGGERGGE